MATQKKFNVIQCLLNVRCWMAIAVTILFVFMSVMGTLPVETTASIITAVMLFYFGKGDSHIVETRGED